MEYIKLGLIDPNPYQPRLSQDKEAMERLARGIAIKREQLPETRGLLQVPMARRVNGRFELAFGHRRLDAFKINNATLGDEWAKIPLNIVELTDEDMYDFAARENGDRADINPIERAHSIVEAQEKFGWTLQRAASAHGLSKSAASNLTRLLELPLNALDKVAQGEISQRHARELVRLMQVDPPAIEQLQHYLEAIAMGMTVATLEAKVSDTLDWHRKHQQLINDVANLTCLRCGGKLDVEAWPQSGICCQKCLTTWYSLSYYNSEKFRLDATKKHEEEIYARRQQKEIRYCRHCGAKVEIDGQMLFAGQSVVCAACGRNYPAKLFLTEKPAAKNDTFHQCQWEPCHHSFTVAADTLICSKCGGKHTEGMAGFYLVAGEAKRLAGEAACPTWREIPHTDETCYLCGSHATWHNNGYRDRPGADFHLCNTCFGLVMKPVMGHYQKAKLQAVLDTFKKNGVGDTVNAARAAQAKKDVETKTLAPETPTVSAETVFRENNNQFIRREQLRGWFGRLLADITDRELDDVSAALDDLEISFFPYICGDCKTAHPDCEGCCRLCSQPCNCCQICQREIRRVGIDAARALNPAVKLEKG